MFYVATELRAALERTHTWYTWVSFSITTAFVAFSAVLLVAVLLSLALLAPSEVVSGEPSTVNDSIIGILGALAFAGGILALAGVVIKVKDRLFPAGIFTISDGRERFERIRFWRRAVLGLGITLPLAVNFTTALILG